MTYDELSTFGRLRKIQRCGPYSMFTKLIHMWKDLYTVTQVRHIMYICVCIVCVCACVHVCMHTYVCVHVCACVCVHACVCGGGMHLYKQVYR